MSTASGGAVEQPLPPSVGASKARATAAQDPNKSPEVFSFCQRLERCSMTEITSTTEFRSSRRSKTKELQPRSQCHLRPEQTACFRESADVANLRDLGATPLMRALLGKEHSPCSAHCNWGHVTLVQRSKAGGGMPHQRSDASSCVTRAKSLLLPSWSIN